jgi:hypothetical protein
MDKGNHNQTNEKFLLVVISLLLTIIVVLLLAQVIGDNKSTRFWFL